MNDWCFTVSEFVCCLGFKMSAGNVSKEDLLRQFLEGGGKSLLDGMGTAPDGIGRVDRTKELALSWAQKRLWFLEQLEDLGAAYHVTQVLRLHGKLEKESLQEALDGILSRHEVLRTVFVRNADGEPVQEILPVQTFVLQYRDLSKLTGVEKERAKKVLTEETLHRPFDLTRDVLIRASLAKLGEQDHVLNLCMHHIV